MTTSIYNNSTENKSRVSNQIRAELAVTRFGEILWHVYRLRGEEKSGSFYFRDAIKARRYVNILKRQGGGWMPKEDFTALCDAMKATTARHYEVTAVDGSSRCSTIVLAKVATDAARIGKARICRIWGEAAKAMQYEIRMAVMPEPEAPKAEKPKRRRSSKKATTSKAA